MWPRPTAARTVTTGHKASDSFSISAVPYPLHTHYQSESSLGRIAERRWEMLDCGSFLKMRYFSSESTPVWKYDVTSRPL